MNLFLNLEEKKKTNIMERTCCAHVEDADLSKIGAGLQSGQNGSPVVGHHLKSSAIDNVHFFAHFA